MNKIASLLSFSIVIFAAVFAFAADRSGEPSTLPSVSAVLPDPLPLDMSEAPILLAPKVRAVPSAVKVASTGAPKVWVCGEPEGLASDVSATVRRCEWR